MKVEIVCDETVRDLRQTSLGRQQRESRQQQDQTAMGTEPPGGSRRRRRRRPSNTGVYPLHPQRASAQDGMNDDFARVPRGAIIVAMMRDVSERPFGAETAAQRRQFRLGGAVHNFAACSISVC
jgi:hypothetical protein